MTLTRGPLQPGQDKLNMPLRRAVHFRVVGLLAEDRPRDRDSGAVIDFRPARRMFSLLDAPEAVEVPVLSDEEGSGFDLFAFYDSLDVLESGRERQEHCGRREGPVAGSARSCAAEQGGTGRGERRSPGQDRTLRGGFE